MKFVVILCASTSWIIAVTHWWLFNSPYFWLIVQILRIILVANWPINNCLCFIICSRFFLILFLHQLSKTSWTSFWNSVNVLMAKDVLVVDETFESITDFLLLTFSLCICCQDILCAKRYRLYSKWLWLTIGVLLLGKSFEGMSPLDFKMGMTICWFL